MSWSTVPGLHKREFTNPVARTSVLGLFYLLFPIFLVLWLIVIAPVYVGYWLRGLTS